MAEWTYRYENDTGLNDEGFWSWFDIVSPAGEVVGRVDDEETAKLFCAALNAYTPPPAGGDG